jgi:AAA domain (Cdc48 subfamily)
VGKSELAKTLASYYFGSEEAMVRLDMSEFMERHTVSKLIGSPPGASWLRCLLHSALGHTGQECTRSAGVLGMEASANWLFWS